MCTGNTSYLKKTANLIQVYPCVYREHTPISRENVPGVGLSLCVQGTRNEYMDLKPLSSVYPCVYREHPIELYEYLNARGLSLCIQGTRT